MRPHAQTRLLVLAVGLLAAGCSDATGPEPSPLGRYFLISVAGDPLPIVTVQSPSGSLELVAGSIELVDQETCLGARTLRQTFQGQVTTVDATEACTYTLDDVDLEVSWERGGVDSGILERDRLTLVTLGIHFVFER
jgi:hypothetical protein